MAQAPDCVSHCLGGAGPRPRRGRRRRRPRCALRTLAALGWENVADDQAEGVSLAMAAAACSVLGGPGARLRGAPLEVMRPYAAPPSSSPGRRLPGTGRPLLGLLAETMGDLALAEVHHDAGAAPGPPHGFTALRGRGGSRAGPDPRRRGPHKTSRVAELLRRRRGGARHGLAGLVRQAAAPA